MIAVDTPCPADVPEHAFRGLQRYAVHRSPVGHFLTAVLSNDLRCATGHADSENLRALKAIVDFIYWELPGNCWGSREKVAAWLRNGEIDAETGPPDEVLAKGNAILEKHEDLHRQFLSRRRDGGNSPE